MPEIGKVIESVDDNNKVKVKLKRTEACGNCGACTTGTQSTDMFIVADNLCNATLDDFVTIELKSSYFFKAVGIMYGIPFVLMMFGFFIGNSFSYLVPSINKDISTFVMGILFMLLGYLGIKINHILKGDSKFLPTATKIVDNPDE